MKKTGIILIGLIFFATTLLIAEDKDETLPAYIEFDSSLGFQYGLISGTGLSYQMWITEDISLMTSFGALYQPVGQDGLWGGSQILDYSLGGEFQYRVYGDDYANWFSAQLYTFLGLNHSGNIDQVEVTPSSSTGVDDDYVYIPAVYGAGSYEPHFTLGLGIGIELILFRHLSIPFELGYAVVWSPLEDSFSKQFGIDLYPQIGFKYRY